MATQPQTLFQKINQLPSQQLAEVEKFVDSLQEQNEKEFLQFQENLPNDEAALVKIIKLKSRIPNRKRFNELVRKRQDEVISQSELGELIAFTEQIEQNAAERVATLARLAQIRKVSLDEVMQQLGLKTSRYE